MASTDSSLFNHAVFSRLLLEALAYPYRLLISLWAPFWKCQQVFNITVSFQFFPNHILILTGSQSLHHLHFHDLESIESFSRAVNDFIQASPDSTISTTSKARACPHVLYVNDLYGFWSSSCSMFHCNPHPRLSSPSAPTRSLQRIGNPRGFLMAFVLV